jgi:hypothetical protein
VIHRTHLPSMAQSSSWEKCQESSHPLRSLEVHLYGYRSPLPGPCSEQYNSSLAHFIKTDANIFLPAVIRIPTYRVPFRLNLKTCMHHEYIILRVTTLIFGEKLLSYEPPCPYITSFLIWYKQLYMAILNSSIMSNTNSLKMWFQ